MRSQETAISLLISQIKGVITMNRKNVYRVLSVLVGVILSILTFTLLLVSKDVGNGWIIGSTCIVVTLSFFGNLIIFALTEK